MKKRHEPLSIRYKYLLSLLILVIPCVIIPVVGTIYVSFSFTRSALELYKSKLEQTSGTLGYLVDGMIGASNIILSDENVNNLLAEKDEFVYEFEKVQSVRAVFQQVEASILYSYDVNLILMDMRGNVYDSKAIEYSTLNQYNELLEQPFCRQLLQGESSLLWVTNAFGYSEGQTERFYPGITLGRLIRDSISQDVLGILILNVKQDSRLKRILLGTTQEDYLQLYITDENGEAFIFSSAETGKPHIDLSKSLSAEDQRQSLLQQAEKAYIKVPLRKLPGYVVGEIRHEYLLKDYMDYAHFQIILNTFFLILTGGAIYFLSGLITRPIIQLSNFLTQAGSGDYSKRIYLKGSLEAKRLSVAVNYMLDETDRLLQRIEVATVEKERARMKVLQAQLTPHFLLNTLNGIKWLCLSDRPKEAAKMMVALGHLLEVSLGTNCEFTTLKEEIDCLQNYVDLQRMRYGDYFHFELDIQENCKMFFVPIFILQPLVENCILHAFPERPNDCRIRVCARTSSDDMILYLIVEDNGVGIPDNWQELALMHNNREHIGLQNMVERLRFYYNLPDTFSIHSSEEGGCTAVIQIPLKPGKEKLD
ncbi:sensor histidine kinase [Ruthenibacterium lactatiformans]|uniref:sensor histidine kinase n=1 Tax=Ruthenibacterium lactatiformans TaxID=1550024 RepID=UPI0026DD4BB2|nr:histidine kinase [Ruthenibacterium lactatiformans]